ncbi:MAG: hemerythrin domain-containing protein [Acetobacteraceae bacterium]|nr:hemerythrin domain-containing protein [Acetobacteraceae bacterium]MBX6744465.1 hemerythrin domain-containing protein [Acetobacteraceae bacterium]
MQDRRRLLAAGLALPAVVTVPALPAAKPAEVTASEDLMREHGVLRRILIVYDELVPKLRGQGGAVDAAALRSLADLFRRFGEDYHEKILEEQNVFPRVRKLGGQTATLVDTLEQQHRRGREITDFISRTAAGGGIGTMQREPLADALAGMVRMYNAHATWEDTVIFPAFRESMDAREYEELGERFEEIERRQFGHDAFEDALKQVEQAQQALGIGDLGSFTAPVPRG